MSADQAAALLAALLLAVVHLLAGRLRFLEGVPRRWLLSAFSGVSVAYVFVHLLPEIAEGDQAIAETATGIAIAVERHAHVLALIGLAVFYGIERAAVTSRMRQRGDRTEGGVFALSVASFALYNAVIGYVLVRRAEEGPTGDMALFAVALGVHFVVNDFGLRDHHKHQYHAIGRWVLAAAVVAGSALALVAEVSEAAVAALIAFLGGGVVLNVLKEELPEERRSRFSAFALGAAAYAAVLLAV